jgi:hypothetical protein
MAEPDKQPVTFEELLVSSLAQTDALAKLKILNIFWKFQVIVCSTTRTAKTSRSQQWRRLT